MIVYYVEGNEGHLMKETMFQQQWRSSVKGQCFSFIMPWAQMIREYNARLTEDDLADLPRGGNCLRYMFRLHLRVAGTDFSKELQQVRLRPCVLVHPLKFLFLKQPDLFSTRNRAMPWLVKRIEDIEAKVHSIYPETEAEIPEHERRGQVPEGFLTEDDEEEDEPDSKKTRTFIMSTKQSTPGSAAETSISETIENSEPRCCVLDSSAYACTNEHSMRQTAIRDFGLAEEKAYARLPDSRETAWAVEAAATIKASPITVKKDLRLAANPNWF